MNGRPVDVQNPSGTEPQRDRGTAQAVDEEFLLDFAFLKIHLPKPKIFAVLFRYKHSEAVHQTQGRGVGKDNGFDGQKGRAVEV